MAYSILSGTGDGVTDTFPINFTLGFISREHIKCRVGDEVDGLGDPVYRSLNWINDGLVQVLGGAPGNGVAYEFTRTVPLDALAHDYTNGEEIEEQNLDDSNKQAIMAVHQVLDGRFEEPFQQDLNLGGHKLTNVGNGVADTDAATVGQIGNAPVFAAAAAASADAAATSKTQTDSVYAATLLVQTAAETARDGAVAAQAAAEAAAEAAAAFTKASTAEAQAGTDDAHFMTALKTVQAMDAVFIKASTAEAQAGTDDAHFMTALKTAQAIAAHVPSGRLVGVRVLTASGTYTKTSGAVSGLIDMVGGGGAGAGVSGSQVGAGGGGAGERRLIYMATLPSTQAFTIGAGGTGVAGGTGNSGGDTVFGSYTAKGGTGAVNSLGNHKGGAGGTGGSGGTGFNGSAGMCGFRSGAADGIGGNGGSTPYGAGGIGAYNALTGSAGGAASGYGAGGGGASSYSSTTQTGGAGAGGIIIIYEYS